ncbi:hypothetical protein D3C81_1965140 [compost metagenome]
MPRVQLVSDELELFHNSRVLPFHLLAQPSIVLVTHLVPRTINTDVIGVFKYAGPGNVHVDSCRL